MNHERLTRAAFKHAKQRFSLTADTRHGKYELIASGSSCDLAGQTLDIARKQHLGHKNTAVWRISSIESIPFGRSSFTICLMIQLNASQANWPAHISTKMISRVYTASTA